MNTRLKWRLLISLLVSLLLVIPGSNITLFDGLPLNPTEAVITAAIFAIIWGTNWHKIRPRIWVGLLSALIIWQVIGYATFPTGWSICLRREINLEFLESKCEPSANFLSGNRTYLWPDINIQNNAFPLHFFNQREFNFYGDSDISREHIPYSFQASAIFHPKQDTSITVDTNTPNTYIDLNGNRTDVIPDNPINLTLASNQTHQVIVGFTAPNNEANNLSITTDLQPYYRQPIFSGQILARIYQTIFYGILIALAILMAMALTSSFSSLQHSDRNILTLMIFPPTALLLLPEIPTSLFYFSASLIILLYCSALTPNKVFLKSMTIIFLFLLSIQYISLHRPYDTASLLEGGNDPLTHESDARSVLLGQTWRERLAGGENDMVFYYQPLYRYFAAAQHALLGDSLWGPYTLQVFLSTLMLLLASELIVLLGGLLPAMIFNAFLIIYWNHIDLSPFTLATTTYQESLSLPLFMLAITGFIWLTCKEKLPHRTHVFWLGILFGSSLGIRTEFLPSVALFLPLIYLFIRRYGKRSALSTALYLLVGTLIPFLFIGIRNLIIAGKWQFLTSSGGVNVAGPFQDIIPRGSSITASEIYIKILGEYWYRPFELVSLILKQGQGSFLGSPVTPTLLWGTITALMLAFAITVYILIKKNLSNKTTIIVLHSASILPFLAGTVLLQDNLLALRAHYSFIFIFTLCFLITQLFTPASYPNKLPHK